MGCKKRSGDFLSSDGHSRTSWFIWTPEEAVPSAILQISHGMCEYIERYESEGFIDAMTSAGFVVCGNDHIGHGRCAQENGDLGYFTDFSNLVDDLHTLNGIVRQTYRSLPYILLGHSMGSFLTRTYLIRYPGTVKAAIIMGTGWQPKAVVAGGLAVARATAAVVGESGTSDLVTQLAFGAYNKQFAPNRTSCDWLSADTDNVDAYMADPLCGADATVGLFRQMLLGIRFNQRLSNLRRMDAQTPVLFIAGDKDPVGANGAGVRRTYQEFLRAGMQDCTLKLYPGLRHEILNEKGWQREIFRDIGLWLTAKL